MSAPPPAARPLPVPGAGRAGAPEREPWHALREEVSSSLFRALAPLDAEAREEDVRKAVSVTSGGKADLAFPVFRWAKRLHRPPEGLAADLAQGFARDDRVQRVWAEGGYVNLAMDPKWFSRSVLGFIRDQSGAYGHLPPRDLPTVCLEHTSANPNSPLHVGRSRNTVIGDTYARALRAAGWPVRTQFYVDDLGRQAAMLVWLWSKDPATWPSSIRDAAQLPADGKRPSGTKADHWYGTPYPATAEYLKAHDEAAKELSDFVQRMETGSMPVAEYRRIPQAILDGILDSLRRFGATFDEFVWESDFILSGAVERAAERVRRSPRYRKTEDGAEGVDGTDVGLPKDSPVVYFRRADGTFLYPARDLAYHLQKFERYGRVIDILGEDHKLHFWGMLALLDAAGAKQKPEVILYGFINLPEGRMTTRGGRVVLLDDALDEARERAREEVRKRREDLSAAEVDRIAESVGSGAVRFHILRVQPEKPIVFRWEEALSFEGKSAPFVQYAHARAASLLRRANGGDDRPMIDLAPLEDQDIPSEPQPKELALVHALSRLPPLVERVAEDGAVHLLALYAHELAERFNEFYQGVRVLDGEPAQRPFRLALVGATRQTLRNTLELIGVEPLERM